MAQLQLPFVDPATAPEAVRTIFATVEKNYGFLPNLYRYFANAPIALEAYLAVVGIFQRGTLSATERNVVLLAAARENGCRYCVAVHSTVADMQKDDAAVTEAIRTGAPIADPKLEALRRLTDALVRGRGHARAEVDAFLAAGYQPGQVLEVLVGITAKTLSNYTNHLVDPPLDAVFAARAWTPERQGALSTEERRRGTTLRAEWFRPRAAASIIVPPKTVTRRRLWLICGI